MPHDMSGPTSGDAPSPRSPSDAEILAIAEQLVRAYGARASADADDRPSAPRSALSPVDEKRVDAALVALAALPPERTIRAESAAGLHTDPYDYFASAAAYRLMFLNTEIAVGNTLLDAAAVTRDPVARVRRVARAQQAHDEVARQLATAPERRFTTAERDALESGLAKLTERLTSAG